MSSPKLNRPKLNRLTRVVPKIEARTGNYAGFLDPRAENRYQVSSRFRSASNVREPVQPLAKLATASLPASDVRESRNAGQISAD